MVGCSFLQECGYVDRLLDHRGDAQLAYLVSANPKTNTNLYILFNPEATNTVMGRYVSFSMWSITNWKRCGGTRGVVSAGAANIRRISFRCGSFNDQTYLQTVGFRANYGLGNGVNGRVPVMDRWKNNNQDLPTDINDLFLEL
jgi:hypothetical protein